MLNKCIYVDAFLNIINKKNKYTNRKKQGKYCIICKLKKSVKKDFLRPLVLYVFQYFTQKLLGE